MNASKSRLRYWVALTSVVAIGSVGLPIRAVTVAASTAVGSKVLSRVAGPFPLGIEPYTAYDGQTKCSRGSKPGVVAFQSLLIERFPGTRPGGIKRSCAGSSVSEHKEGRALDWGVNAYDASDKRMAKKAIRWLFRTDSRGNEHAIARRLGIMYIIWNKRMWRAYRPFDGWRPYRGSSPHTDHMHFSFARAGGLGLTSFWTGKVADLPAAYIGEGYD